MKHATAAKLPKKTPTNVTDLARRAHTERKAMWQCPTCRRAFANRNQSHACGTHDLEHHFAGKPPAIRNLYEAVIQVLRTIGPVTVQPEKTRTPFKCECRLRNSRRAVYGSTGIWYSLASLSTRGFARTRHSLHGITSTISACSPRRTSMLRSANGLKRLMLSARKRTSSASRRMRHDRVFKRFRIVAGRKQQFTDIFAARRQMSDRLAGVESCDEMIVATSH